MIAEQPNATIEMLENFLNLTSSRMERLRFQGPNLDRAYRVLNEFQSRIGETDLYRIITHEYVLHGAIGSTFDDSIRMVEALILPYAEELAQARDDSVSKVIRGMVMRSELMDYRDSFFVSRSRLSDAPEVIKEVVNELRIITSVWSLDVPRYKIADVISRTNSPPTLQLSLNTPLYLLLKENPERCDDMIAVIRSERETNGVRIAAMMDSTGTPMRSGAL